MNIRIFAKKFVALCFFLSTLLIHLPMANAATLTSISTSLASAKPDVTTNYTINFTTASLGTLKKISFYFVKASDNFNKPATLDLTNASYSFATGITFSNWSIDTSAASNGTLSLNYNDGESIAANTAVSVQFSAIDTPELGDCTVSGMIYDVCYLSISTFTDGGTIVDNGGATYTIEDDNYLRFNVTGVNSGTSTNGVTTTVSSDFDELDFGSLKINKPEYMAQRLFVATTAPHGYTVTMALDGYMQGLEPNNVITPFLPTNGAWTTPQSWESPEGETNSDSGWVGANTSDTRVTGWSDASGKFGPVSSTAHEVMYSSGRDRSGTQAYVTYAMEVNENQLPDSYSGTIVYNILVKY